VTKEFKNHRQSLRNTSLAAKTLVVAGTPSPRARNPEPTELRRDILIAA